MLWLGLGEKLELETLLKISSDVRLTNVKMRWPLVHKYPVVSHLQMLTLTRQPRSLELPHHPLRLPTQKSNYEHVLCT